MPKTLPECGYVLDGIECHERGDHFCVPRADHCQRFIEELCLHTKGQFLRRKFILAAWQRDDIIRPLFGTVVWSEEFQAYKRQYEIAWIEVARKALAVDTPLLTANRGWITIGDAQIGDEVYTLDGSTTTVNWVSPVFMEKRFEVRSRFGRSLIAGADHDWAVLDRRYPQGALRGVRDDGHRTKPEYRRTAISTAEMESEGLRLRTGYRFALPRHEALKGVGIRLPIDPYALGAWLGDGTSKSGAMTSHEDDQPFMRAQFEAAGYETRATAHPQVFYVLKLMTHLRWLGVLHNKHVPECYLEAPEDDRRALLQGLMDTDGWCSVKGNSLIAGFCAKSEDIARSVLFLARSLGFQAHLSIKKKSICNGKEYGPFFEVFWALSDDLPMPFRLPRKAGKVRSGTYRPQLDSITSIEPVGEGLTRCIGVEHPDSVFLAGRDLMPTANCGKTEILAALMLYLLVGDGEASAEIYGIAKTREQASLCFDVAAQMVRLQPILNKRLKIIAHKKRIYDAKTNSFYQVVAADAGGALGSNPSGVGADEICAWHDGGMWDSMRTGMGSGARRQPMMIAATTAGTDTESFAGKMHRELLGNWEKPDDDPNKLKHIFCYIRNTPMDADPWDEKNWFHASPALGDFLSVESFRKQAAEAKANPLLENGFRVLKLNQWTTQAVRWMPMHLFDESAGVKFASAKEGRDDFTGRDCWFGLDLAARQDLTAMCYLFPDPDGVSVDLLWRFWACEAAVFRLDKLNGGRFRREFVPGGWLTVTEGDVLDFDRVYADIEADARRFNILGGDADKWSSDPVLQEIQNRIYVPDDIYAYQNDFTHMSDSMHRIIEMTTERKFRWHGNPLARFCFEGAEARVAPYNPDLVRPDKPDRKSASKRIDAVPAAIMATNAWWTRGDDAISMYASMEPAVVGMEG